MEATAIGVLEAGEKSLQGHRPSQEDRSCLDLNVVEAGGDGQGGGSGGRRALLAVLDGHGGHVCAEFCRRHLGGLLSEQLAGGGDDGDSLRGAVLAVEAAFASAAADLNLASTSGSCLVAALVGGGELHVANVGDSRAVLCRAGHAVALSEDHKPSRGDERARVLAAGGLVGRSEARARSAASLGVRLSEAVCCCARRGPLRVYPGGLAVTRSLGDIGTAKAGNAVTAEPEMRSVRLTAADEFVLLACDGVWDVMSRRDAVGVVRAELAANGGSAERAAAHLAQTAINRHTLDNVTVMVATLGVPANDAGSG